MFGIEGNEKQARILLAALFNTDFSNHKITISKDKERLPILIDGKVHNLDVVLNIDNTTEVLVEMQVNNSDNMPQRLISYASTSRNTFLKKGHTYANQRKIVASAILGYIQDKTKINSNYSSNYDIMCTDIDANLKSNDFKNSIMYTLIELPKLIKKLKQSRIPNSNVKLTVNDYVLLFISNPHIKEVQNMVSKNTKLQLLNETFEKILADGETLDLYLQDQEFKRREAYRLEKSHEKGVAKGEKKRSSFRRSNWF